jgi:hypothetical protein
MKIDPFRQTDSEPVRRKRREHDEPKAEDKAPRKWKEPEGFFQGARVKRR